MKLVYFIDHLRPDGTQFVLKQLVEGLAARGHKQIVICLNDSWDVSLVSGLHEAGGEVRIVGKRALISGVGFLILWRRLRRSRFDVAVTFLFASDTVGRALARAAGGPRSLSLLRGPHGKYSTLGPWGVRNHKHLADAGAGYS